ncbi:hypothetical protein GRI75_12700 [Altererythrobacter soli]|uniref:Uncharacterized protein n=1 Tax=Croceibacterium soli TaxID=1739690 RepID=A0A6I4UXK2_9SPHN|nr:hypothetical protein [Croceibacterium soli]MXP42499.1 hypothetical protein [Croceibacterium soli]
MFDRHFFASKLGASALVSVAMMLAFNAYALSTQLGGAAGASTAGASSVGIALVVLA